MDGSGEHRIPSFESVGVAGGGFMGSGIAETAARAELPVVVYEPEEEGLEAARRRIEASTARAVERGKLGEEDAAALRERIELTTSIADLGSCDVAIEAVPEVMEVKRAVYEELDAVLPAGATIASNTSSIPISSLAAAVSRPDRVIGLHFFSPVPVMKLVEVVVALETSEETVRACDEFCSRIGKRPIHTKDRSGFIVNMLLVPYLMAAVRMYEEGFASREDIDEGMRLGCGHPMGPLALCDLIGLDVLYSVCESLYEEFKQPEYAPPPLLKRMVAAERLGQKAGRGFYTYESAREPVAV